MAKKKVKDIVAELLVDFLAENDLELFNVEFVKEGRERFLRVYIDKPERPDGQDEYVDEEDPIAENYMLEVSSPGLDRPLIREDDYRRYAGRLVDVKLYKAIDNRKQFCAELVELNEGIVSFIDEKNQNFEIPFDQISKINLSVII